MGNIVMAQGGIPIQQGIYEESITKKCELGRLLPFLDGRCFRYCHCASGAGITRGHMASGPTVVAEDNTVTQTSMTVAISGGTVGAKVVNVLLAAVATTANLYEDGLLVIEDADGEGYAYRIRSNKAGGAAVATPCELTLYDPIVVALAADNIITLTKNRYKDLVITPITTIVASPIGVPLIDVTKDYYFWAQTKGYAPLYVDDASALTVGMLVCGGGGEPGACILYAAGTISKAWGTAVQIAAVDTYATIDLELE